MHTSSYINQPTPGSIFCPKNPMKSFSFIGKKTPGENAWIQPPPFPRTWDDWIPTKEWSAAEMTARCSLESGLAGGMTPGCSRPLCGGKFGENGVWNYWDTVDGQNPAPVEVASFFSHYLQGFIHPRWCTISSINSMFLLGVFSPTHLKNMSQNGFIFPNFRGEHIKHLKPPPRFFPIFFS